ncbi:MAG: hypothetical protein OXN17_01815 [Candidatus Poribacteria bacterium]|nr:hypothetical protein [Candidatus Poribacteria bacterium]MDE0503845.1 hypothetical protein [Candidatus Poribacteria bacterium]
MSTCKQPKASHIEYVCNLLNDAQIAAFNSHLRDCSDCRTEVKALEAVVNLTDTAEAEFSSRSWELRDIEMEVYRRLAAENEQKDGASLFSRVRRLSPFRLPMRIKGDLLDSFRSTGFRQLWPRVLTGCAFVAVLLISVCYFDGDQPAKLPVVKIEVLPSNEQLEHYRSQDIHQSLEELLVIKHLRNDEWETAARARMLNDMAQGTRYESIAMSSFR